MISYEKGTYEQAGKGDSLPWLKKRHENGFWTKPLLYKNLRGN
jgi:hypothetical protein